MFPTFSSKWYVHIAAQRPGFNARPVCLGFVLDKAALEWVFLPILQISPVSIIPPMLHPHSLICHCHYITLATDIIK
jgi:hypothetical protein